MRVASPAPSPANRTVRQLDPSMHDHIDAMCAASEAETCDADRIMHFGYSQSLPIEEGYTRSALYARGSSREETSRLVSQGAERPATCDIRCHASRSWQGLILIELGSAHVRLGSGY